MAASHPNSAGDCDTSKLLLKKKAFTLAEVLITLAIIGIVAALTIPSVISSYKDKQYNTARLKALKTFGEAGKMASINDEMNSQANATDFVNKVLSKYLKISKICDNSKPNDCGFPSKIQPLDSTAKKILSSNLTKWSQLGFISSSANALIQDNASMSIIILTADGFSAKVFYNPACGRNSHEITPDPCSTKECYIYPYAAACMSVVYDMNGNKGPNHISEDVGFVTVFWSGAKAVAVAPGLIPYNETKAIYDEGTKTQTEAQNTCSNAGTKKMSYSLPNVDEAASLSINQNLASLPQWDTIWTGSHVDGDDKKAWGARTFGARYAYSLKTPLGVWCVRR